MKRLSYLLVLILVITLFGCAEVGMKNNYITFDRIDSSGVSQSVKEQAKVVWDELDNFIELGKKNENAALIIPKYLELQKEMAKLYEIALQVNKTNPNYPDFTFVDSIIEHLRIKCLKNNMSSTAKIFESIDNSGAIRESDFTLESILSKYRN